MKKLATKHNFEPYFDADGNLIHPCRICGSADASFGFGVSLLKNQLGRWYCSKCVLHRPGLPPEEPTTTTKTTKILKGN